MGFTPWFDLMDCPVGALMKLLMRLYAAGTTVPMLHYNYLKRITRIRQMGKLYLQQFISCVQFSDDYERTESGIGIERFGSDKRAGEFGQK